MSCKLSITKKPFHPLCSNTAASQTPAFPVQESFHIILGSGGRKYRTFEKLAEPLWTLSRILQNLMANAGLRLVSFCLKSMAKQLQLSVSISASSRVLHLGQFRFLPLESIPPAIRPSVSSRIQGCINWYLGRLKMH